MGTGGPKGIVAGTWWRSWVIPGEDWGTGRDSWGFQGGGEWFWWFTEGPGLLS